MARTLVGVYRAKFVYEITHRAVDWSKIEWTKEPVLEVPYKGIMSSRLKKYGTRVAHLAAKSREVGATPIFVTQPTRRYKIVSDGLYGAASTAIYENKTYNGVDYYFMMRELDLVTMEICRQNNGLCYDLAGEFFWDGNDFYDYAHMTPKGAKKVGEKIFEFLKERL